MLQEIVPGQAPKATEKPCLEKTKTKTKKKEKLKCKVLDIEKILENLGFSEFGNLSMNA